MTKTIGLTIAMTATMALAGCNTVDGAGKDLKSTGNAISKASGKEAGKK